MAKYSIDVPILVSYADTDQMGVAYHANYIVWFNIARDALLKKIGINVKSIESMGYVSPIREISCKYVASARYDDELIIEARCDMQPIPKFEVFYRVFLKHKRTLLAEGRTLNVIIDKKGNLLFHLPEELLELLKR